MAGASQAQPLYVSSPLSTLLAESGAFLAVLRDFLDCIFSLSLTSHSPSAPRDQLCTFPGHQD